LESLSGGLFESKAMDKGKITSKTLIAFTF